MRRVDSIEYIFYEKFLVAPMLMASMEREKMRVTQSLLAMAVNLLATAFNLVTRMLLGAPGPTTRSKEATRGPLPPLQ